MKSMLAGGKIQNESFNSGEGALDGEKSLDGGANSGESPIHRSYNGKNEYRKKPAKPRKGIRRFFSIYSRVQDLVSESSM